MANITAAEVKRLRDATGAGMMDAKRALEETGGDFDQAIEVLRVKGAAKAAKRAERTAANGLVAAAEGAMIELACETDFVAKSEQFQQLAADIVAHAAARQIGDVATLLGETLADGHTVEERIAAASAVIGEKLELRRAVFFSGGNVASYLHKRATDLPPQVGVLVEFAGEDAERARGAAMQIAAMRPQYLTRDEVPDEIVANERRIAEANAREEGKPEGALPKIVEGRVNSFYKDVVLLEQPSVLEPKKTVRQLLDEAGVTVRRFARFEVGQA